MGEISIERSLVEHQNSGRQETCPRVTLESLVFGICLGFAICDL
jgi:hypothetical protein